MTPGLAPTTFRATVALALLLALAVAWSALGPILHVGGAIIVALDCLQRMGAGAVLAGLLGAISALALHRAKHLMIPKETCEPWKSK